MTGARRTAATLVLVHGAWHGAWCWEKVIPRLLRAGVRSVAVDLPFTGFEEDVSEIRRTTAEVAGPVVLCGHSFGGRSVSAAANGLSDVVHLVYLAGLMLDAEQLETFAISGGMAPSPRLDAYDLELVRERFYHDCPQADALAAFRRLRPMQEPPGGMTGLGPMPWLHIPSTYLVCEHDRTVPPAAQREMAANARYVVDLPTGHSPFLSRPERLAEILASIVRDGAPAGRRASWPGTP